MKKVLIILMLVLSVNGFNLAGQCTIVRTLSGPTSVCAGSTGNVYTTEPGNNNYDWTITGGNKTSGGGNNDNTVTVTWTSGTGRSVEVNYRDVNNCDDAASAVTLNVTVNPLPSVTFTSQPGSDACLEAELNYTTQSGMTNYLWNIPGTVNTDYTITSGGTLSDNSVTLKYLTTGNKTATINYTNGNGCTATSATSSTTTNLHSLPVVAFSSQPGAGPYCTGVNLTYTTTAGRSPYYWGFPGILNTDYSIISGGSGSDNTVTLRYLTSGSKTVTVNYTNSNGCVALLPTSGTATTINETPVVTFTSQPGLNTCLNNNVTYTTQSGMSSYSWVFPGVVNTDYSIISGGTGSDNSVTLKYLTTGSKTVTINYTTTDGCSAPSATSGIATNVNPLPTITFSEQPGSASCTGIDVTYTTQSGMTSYIWGFPGILNTDYSITSGGTPASNSVTLKYLTTGSKTVTVNYTNTNGCTAAVPKSGNATTVYSLPVVTFTSEPLTGPYCAETNLTYTTQSGMSSYEWVFPGGLNTDYAIISGGTGTSNSVTLKYLTSGGKIVTVNYTNTNGCTAIASESSVSTTIKALPVVTFTAQPGANVCIGTDLTYSTQSGMTSYVWGFPGVLNTDYSIISGGTASDNSVILRYLTAGTKTVTVNYTSSNGCSAASSASSSPATVRPLPQGSLSANGPFCDTGTGQLRWDATAGTGPFTIIYYDGTANRSRNNVTSGIPFDVFSNPVTGSATYSLVSVTDAYCSRTTDFTGPSATITVNPLPAVITGTTTACEGLTTILNDITPGGEWSSMNPAVALIDAGGVVTGVSGGTAEIRYTLIATSCYRSATVTVNPAPVVTTPSTANVCTGTNTNIILASSVPSTFVWTIGTITGGITGAAPGSGDAIIQLLTNPSLTSAGTVQYIVTPTSTAGLCSGLPYTITVSVNPLPRLTGASQSLTVCSGSSATINLLGLLPNTTSAISYEINMIAQAPVTGVMSNSSGIASFNTATVTDVNNGQLLRVTGVTNTSYAPACYQGFVQDLALSVDKPSSGGSVSAVPAICSGQTPADLNLTGVTGFIVKWQKSANAGFTSPIDIPYPTSPLTGLVTGPLTSSTYFRAVAKNGVCPEAVSAGSLVTVNSLPLPVISGPAAVNIGTSGHVYSTDPGMNSYTWTISPGGNITSGSGTNSIIVAWTASGSQYVRVNFKNASGCTAISPSGYDVQVNAKPVAVGVTILGEARSRMTLTGTFLYTDIENDPVETSSLVYQWYTGTDQNGAGSVPIPLATGVSYVVRDADMGKYIGFSVIPAAQSGATPGNMASSLLWVGPVDNDPPKANSVSIVGLLAVNSIITGTYTYSDREGDIERPSKFQWYSAYTPAGPFTAVSGDTNQTHLITNEEQGKYFRFSVIPRAETGRSPGSAVVVTTAGRVNSRPFADNIVVSGFAGIDSTLTATWSYNDIDGDLRGTSNYRWLRDGTDPVPGATGTSYKATAADEGKTLVFEVTPVAATGLTPGEIARSVPTAVVIDASGNIPSAQEVCIQGNRRINATLIGKYHYEFYKSEAGSKYRWLRNNVPIPGATGTTYTLTEADIARGVDITFEVTPVSSNYIPKVGLPVPSNPLSRIKLDRTAYSIADPAFKLEATVPNGFFSGKGVVGDEFDPGVADTIGSPHKITYQATITNTITVCPQQAYDSIYVFPIDPYFVGLDTLYCFDESPSTVAVTNIPEGATDLKIFSPNSAIIQSVVSDTSVVIDPSKKGKDPRELLQFSFIYKGSLFAIKKEFEIVYLEPAKIALNPGDKFCTNDKLVKLYPNLTGSDGVGEFFGPVTGDSFDPSKGLGNENVTFTYTNTRSGCQSSVTVPVIIYPAPEPAFAPVSTCIETINKDITQFTNKTTSADQVSAWDWKFYDGGGYGASTTENPGYAFKIGGQHKVTLTAATINQCIAEKDSTIDIGIRPVIGFTWKNECFKAESDYNDTLLWFFDKSTAPSEIKTWRWTFNGGTPVLNDTAAFRKSSPGFVTVNYEVETNYAGCGASTTRQVYIRPTISLADADYNEGFENGAGGWVKDYETKNSWAFGTPNRTSINRAASGVNAWFTNYGMTGQTAENSAVISPCFRMDSVERPMIILKTWKRFDRDRDGAVLQYQVGDSVTAAGVPVWQPVGTIEDDGIKWFNSALINGNPGGKQIGWTSGTGNIKDTTWYESRHALDELAGVTRDVKFRIAYGSDGTAKNNDGIAFDDILIGERTRGVLLEHFTNANATLSPGSKAANDLVNSIVSSREKDIINIQYHTNFPGSDNYYSDNPGDAGARFLFYGLSRAPFTMTDGGTDPNNYASVFNYTTLPFDPLKIIRRSLINPSFQISLNATQDGGILNIRGEIRALESVNAENLTLYLVVTEKESAKYPLPGEPVFYNVFRKLIPDAAGISLKNSWQPNETFTIPEKTWTVNKIANSAEIEVVAFIQNNITKFVYQAEKDTLKDISVGIEGINSLDGNGFSLYPNPSAGRLNIVFENALNSVTDITIFDFAGTVVRSYKAGISETSYTIEDLALKNGIYLVKVSTDGRGYVFRKLIVSGR